MSLSSCHWDYVLGSVIQGIQIFAGLEKGRAAGCEILGCSITRGGKSVAKGVWPEAN